jgi:hypothetical protein
MDVNAGALVVVVVLVTGRLHASPRADDEIHGKNGDGD